MTDRLITALQSKKVFLQIEEHLLRKARILYSMGFTSKCLTSSQMAGVSSLLLDSPTIEKAHEKLVNFIENQLKKLKEKERRSGKKTSWLTETVDNGDQFSLGETLVEWVKTEKYLEGVAESDRIDRLVLLQRFWSNVYGFHCYHKTFGTDMPLEED